MRWRCEIAILFSRVLRAPRSRMEALSKLSLIASISLSYLVSFNSSRCPILIRLAFEMGQTQSLWSLWRLKHKIWFCFVIGVEEFLDMRTKVNKYSNGMLWNVMVQLWCKYGDMCLFLVFIGINLWLFIFAFCSFSRRLCRHLWCSHGVVLVINGIIILSRKENVNKQLLLLIMEQLSCLEGRGLVTCVS